MASARKARWKSWRRFAEKLVFDEGPRLIRQLRDAPSVQRGIEHGIKAGIDALTSGRVKPSAAVLPGRPVASISAPTAHRARRISYAPDLHGRADPGEVIWAWVADADDPGRGADRPVLVVGRDRHTLLGLLLSSHRHRSDDPDWVGVGAPSWDDAGRPSWVRLDRVLDVPEAGIRREGAILDRSSFDIVAARLRADYSWS